jgi:hypothetical protein
MTANGNALICDSIAAASPVGTESTVSGVAVTDGMNVSITAKLESIHWREHNGASRQHKHRQSRSDGVDAVDAVDQSNAVRIFAGCDTQPHGHS